MNKILDELCPVLKKIIDQLRPNNTPLAFTILIGPAQHGKSTLTEHLDHGSLPNSVQASMQLTYNKRGIILECSELWLQKNSNQLIYFLKRITHCHPNMMINGILYCLDIAHLASIQPDDLWLYCQEQITDLTKFVNAFEYNLPIGLVISKLDLLSGFVDFFQSDHIAELIKPLGFNVDEINTKADFLMYFNTCFDKLIQSIEQQVINKLHSARSNQKRTAIREFPLQLASLRVPLQAFLQLSHSNHLPLKVIYFTSACQGGISIDKLSHKIEKNYAICAYNAAQQAANNKLYFVRGAVYNFQQLTQKQYPSILFNERTITYGAGIIIAGFMLVLFLGTWQITKKIDNIDQNLINYATYAAQADQRVNALYHLSQASKIFHRLPRYFVEKFTLNIFGNTLDSKIMQLTQNILIPKLKQTLENIMTNAQEESVARYEALKIYLMLNDSDYFNSAQITAWFAAHWSTHLSQEEQSVYASLLKQALHKHLLHNISINEVLVRDTRNYLNILPTEYLYYSLAKAYFPAEAIAFHLHGMTTNAKVVPFMFTRAGFKKMIILLPQITHKLLQDNWVLMRQDLQHLDLEIQAAYCKKYVAWWQAFIHETHPESFTSYDGAQLVFEKIRTNDSITNFINLIQHETEPDESKSAYSVVFNQKIASLFTSINLVNQAMITKINKSLYELQHFLKALNLVSDHEDLIFKITRKRFLMNATADPLSQLYNRIDQLPEPLVQSIRYLANDTWFLFINESKHYLNRIWHEHVYDEYTHFIQNHYPFTDTASNQELSLEAFDHFFSPQGTMLAFVKHYITPFLNTTNAQWAVKARNGYVLPINMDLINELIRANIISTMFFPNNEAHSQVRFTLEKLELDPIISTLSVAIDNTSLTDDHDSDSYTAFSWPNKHVKLTLKTINGKQYNLEEQGPWALFKLIQKINVIPDPEDSANLQILFEINGNAGRYLLKTDTPMNPFNPHILSGFFLHETLS